MKVTANNASVRLTSARDEKVSASIMLYVRHPKAVFKLITPAITALVPAPTDLSHASV